MELKLCGTYIIIISKWICGRMEVVRMVDEPQKVISQRSVGRP